MGKEREYLERLQRRLNYLEETMKTAAVPGVPPVGRISYILAEANALRWALARLRDDVESDRQVVQAERERRAAVRGAW